MGNIWVPPPILSTWKLGGGGAHICSPPLPHIKFMVYDLCSYKGGGGTILGSPVGDGGGGAVFQPPPPPLSPFGCYLCLGGGGPIGWQGGYFWGRGGHVAPPSFSSSPNIGCGGVL